MNDSTYKGKRKVTTPEILEARRKAAARRQAEWRERKAAGLTSTTTHGRTPGALNMATREMIEKARGKPLAREVLEETMIRCLTLARRWYPLDAEGNERVRVVQERGQDGQVVERQVPVGNHGLFMEAIDATARYANWLAQYQSPKLSAIAVAAPQSSRDEKVVMEINVFGDRGELMKRVVDGRQVALPHRVITHNDGGQDGSE